VRSLQIQGELSLRRYRSFTYKEKRGPLEPLGIKTHAISDPHSGVTQWHQSPNLLTVRDPVTRHYFFVPFCRGQNSTHLFTGEWQGRTERHRGALSSVAGFSAIQFRLCANRKNARIRSSFLALERGPSFHHAVTVHRPIEQVRPLSFMRRAEYRTRVKEDAGRVQSGRKRETYCCRWPTVELAEWLPISPVKFAPFPSAGEPGRSTKSGGCPGTEALKAGSSRIECPSCPEALRQPTKSNCAPFQLKAAGLSG